MKLALVRARYSPFGGAERFAMRAMQTLAAQGAEVTIIARSWSGAADPPPAGGPGLRFLRCDPFYIGSLWRDASFAHAVRSALKNEFFDLVQSHERIAGMPIYRAGDGVHAVWLARRGAGMSRVRRWSMNLNPHHRYLMRTERRMFEHPALRAVICNSRMVRDEIAAHFAISCDKLHIVANGIDLDRFHPSLRDRFRAEMRSRLAIDENAPCFLLVGSGFERKGVATALRALARANAKAELCAELAAVLVVVGDDKRISRYRRLAEALGVAAQVRFAGAQPDPAPYYALADAFVLPSIYDPFPNAALEALACGLPVIVSDACGIKEAVAQGSSGWVCPAGDENCLASAMFELRQRIADPASAASLRAAARAAAKPYSLSALGQALQTLYGTMLER